MDEEIIGLNLRGKPAPSSATPAVRPSVEAETPQAPEVREVKPLQPPGPWSRRYLLLLLALVPLLMSMIPFARQDDLKVRLAHTIESLPEDRQRAIAEQMKQSDGTIDGLLNVLPDHRVEGAHLDRDTWRHWIYAGTSGVGFLAFLIIAFPSARPEWWRITKVALFTGTVGIVLLLAFQVAAAISQGIWLRGFNVVTLIFYIVKLIGYSYSAALDPDNGFFLSCLGFILGVGFCEEACKVLPLIGWGKRIPDWRAACLWGLASGVGFGVSEGITYASDYYNGLAPVGIYVVRFIACVALHAIWSGAAAITLFERREWLGQGEGVLDPILRIARIVAVPMALHGLYDTLLKKDMDVLALVTALVSFGWLVYQAERALRAETRAWNTAMMASASA